jgi:hypothetical protein
MCTGIAHNEEDRAAAPHRPAAASDQRPQGHHHHQRHHHHHHHHMGNSASLDECARDAAGDAPGSDELSRREEELRQRKMAAQARIAEAEADAAEARNQREQTPRRLKPPPRRRLTTGGLAETQLENVRNTPPTRAEFEVARKSLRAQLSGHDGSPAQRQLVLGPSSDALSDPGSDVSEPSLLSFSRADSALSEALETLQQREEELRRSEVQQRQEELWRREEELRQRKMAAQARIAEADAEAAEARNQRRLDEARRPPQRLTPQRLTPRRLTCTPQRRPNGVLRRSCRDYDIALHQRVQYLSESQGRWVSATVTRLNSDLSVDFVGEDGLIRENYFIFRNGRRVIR